MNDIDVGPTDRSRPAKRRRTAASFAGGLTSAFAVLALVSATAAAGPPEEPAPGRVTPEEAAAGWVQLFDGKDFSGLRIDGDAAVKDGVLVIGGARPATVGVKRQLGEDFELRLYYRTEGPGRLGFRSESHGMTSSAGSGTTVPEPPALVPPPPEWHELRCRCRPSHGGGGYEIMLENWHDGRVVDSNRNGSLGGGTSPPDVWFEVPAGSTLLLRGAKARPDTAWRWWRSAWGFAAVLGAVLLLLIVVVVLIVRRLRRSVLLPAVPPMPPEQGEDDVAPTDEGGGQG